MKSHKLSQSASHEADQNLKSWVYYPVMQVGHIALSWTEDW